MNRVSCMDADGVPFDWFELDQDDLYSHVKEDGSCEIGGMIFNSFEDAWDFFSSRDVDPEGILTEAERDELMKEFKKIEVEIDEEEIGMIGMPGPTTITSNPRKDIIKLYNNGVLTEVATVPTSTIPGMVSMVPNPKPKETSLVPVSQNGKSNGKTTYIESTTDKRPNPALVNGYSNGYKPATTPAQPKKESDKPIIYFAYGSNLNMTDLSRYIGNRNAKKGEKAVTIEKIANAFLPDYRLVFNSSSGVRNGGVASIVKSPGDVVPGVLYLLSKEAKEYIDMKEGAYRSNSTFWDDYDFFGTGPGSNGTKTPTYNGGTTSKRPSKKERREARKARENGHISQNDWRFARNHQYDGQGRYVGYLGYDTESIETEEESGKVDKAENYGYDPFDNDEYAEWECLNESFRSYTDWVERGRGKAEGERQNGKTSYSNGYSHTSYASGYSAGYKYGYTPIFTNAIVIDEGCIGTLVECYTYQYHKYGEENTWGKEYFAPSQEYYDIIKDGYFQNGLESWIECLDAAALNEYYPMIIKNMFVYGSLMTGMGNHSVSGHKLYFNGTVSGLKMYALGGFPGCVKCSDKDTPDIKGEVIVMPDSLSYLQGLDRLEGFKGYGKEIRNTFYIRTLCQPMVGNQKFLSWIYILPSEYRTSNIVVSDGNWRRYQNDYGVGGWSAGKYSAKAKAKPVVYTQKNEVPVPSFRDASTRMLEIGKGTITNTNSLKTNKFDHSLASKPSLQTHATNQYSTPSSLPKDKVKADVEVQVTMPADDKSCGKDRKQDLVDIDCAYVKAAEMEVQKVWSTLDGICEEICSTLYAG